MLTEDEILAAITDAPLRPTVRGHLVGIGRAIEAKVLEKLHAGQPRLAGYDMGGAPDAKEHAPAVRVWQHDETGRITETPECPGPRWTEVPAGVPGVPRG